MGDDKIRTGGLVDIDLAGGTAYVSLAQDLAASVGMTRTLSATLNVDYAEDGTVMGFEVLFEAGALSPL